MMQTPRERRSRALRWLRLGAYVAVLCGLSTWWMIHRAAAEFHERSLEVGHELAKLKDLMAGTTTMEFNGERLTLTSASTDHDIGTVLDRFSAACARESGGLTDALQEMVARGAQLPDELRPETAGILRSQKGESEGAAACFARPGRGGVQDLVARVLKVAETGEFGALGQLRYVFARRREGARSTHVISVSAHGPLSLERMFPEHGDVPGSDLFEGARPVGARRLISARVEGSKQHAAIYQSPQPPEQALGGFDAPLRAQGFATADVAPLATLSAVPTRVYVKADDMVLVVAEPDPRDGQTSISAFRLLNGGFAMMRP